MQRRNFLKSCVATLVYGRVGNLGARIPAVMPVSFDERSLLVHGKRVLLSCGSVHYPRSTRAMWPQLLQRSKALGLNAIATYVFWNIHEPQRGVYDFAGERDLGHYLDLCQEHGLMIFLRAGPYICAEWNFGGFPPYLRNEPGITIRTMDKPYTDRVEAFLEQLAQVVQPRLASRGGPVILVQIENEYANVAKRYGAAGQEYLHWIVQAVNRVGLAEVPTTTCEGGAHGAIETSNGNTITQERIDALRRTHPGTPLIWSELYPSWYRVWGGAIRPPRGGPSLAAGILDFISRGGSGWNYYPWHGGTNFGRTSMYLQTTSYDFDAALDEYGAVTPTGEFLGTLHHLLEDNASLLLEGERSEQQSSTGRTVIWHRGADILRLEQSHDLQQARLIDGSGRLLFDTLSAKPIAVWNLLGTNRPAHSASISPNRVAAGRFGAWQALNESAVVRDSWLSCRESIPGQRGFQFRGGIQSADPIEQLLLTHDSSDYCWYSTSLQVEGSEPGELLIPYGGDMFYVFVDGKMKSMSRLPLEENRGPITPPNPAHPRIIANPIEMVRQGGFRHSFTLAGLAPGKHHLALLAVALGMIKGDWQIASPMNFERKGIWEGVQWNRRPLRGWTMIPGLSGEQAKFSNPAISGIWSRTTEGAPLTWYRRKLDVPASLLHNGAQFRVDASGLGKGLLWVNGRCLGRYWLLAATAPGDVQSQRFYHLPADWLRPSNEIVLFEEQSMTPRNLTIQFRTEITYG